MNIDKFNSEGYYDPTSYEAMTNVVKADKQSAFRPLVYICSPFSGDTEYNSNQARKYSRFAYEQNTIPVTPHLLSADSIISQAAIMWLGLAESTWKTRKNAPCSTFLMRALSWLF